MTETAYPDPATSRRGRRRRGGEQQSLTAALSDFLVKKLLPDLATRAKDSSVRAALARRWEHEKATSRTGESFDEWTARTLEQVGAAWILSCVFLRTLEDRGLLAQRRIAGPGAQDSQQLFHKLAPRLSSRDYLLTAFREVSRLPGTEELLGPDHNPAWRLSPSVELTNALVELFRQTDEAGALRWSFAGTDTRFLGDLYQDLSASVRERYALLQTPDFVEEFILDLTLTPAIKEFGLEKVRLIDPTCGSGHFLLGAFDRLFEERLRTAPAIDKREHALAALGQVYGVDLNPYAVAIARFRLVLSFLGKAGISKLSQAPRLKLNLVVADSLLHGAQGATLLLSDTAEDRKDWGDSIFDLEDAAAGRAILSQRYHAVVGNPPYITCKDATLRDAYRRLYRSCYREYALAAPCTERFFQLALPASEGGGFVGLINANSFLKREFGKALIEKVLAHIDLTRVLDTSGAYIPGHGTPTVLLFGRNRPASGEPVRAVMGKRGEPQTPEDPRAGLVWAALAGHYDEAGFENEYISVSDVAKATFHKHPWSLGGGGAAELKTLLEERSARRLEEVVELIGFGAVTREDEVFMLARGARARWRLPQARLATYGYGEGLRDWQMNAGADVFFPYDANGSCVPEETGRYLELLWCFRTQLWLREGKGFKTKKESGGQYYEYSMFYPERYFTPLKLAFAFVATHNHFVLDRGGKVFNRSAPIIKLPDSATEADHLALLGYMNSSALGFWGRMVFSSKGAQGVNEGFKTEAWEQFLEYAGTPLAKAPVPTLNDNIRRLSASILTLAERRESDMPRKSLRRWVPGGLGLADELELREREAARVLACVCALQEELDWLIYDAFGVLTPDDRSLLHRVRGEAWPDFPTRIDDPPESLERTGLHPGHRAFEVVLARDCLVNGTKTAWFERNGYRSPSEITSTYSPACQRLIEARVAIIDRNAEIRLIEKPEFKRRWTLRDFGDEAKAAAAEWLLDAAEALLKNSTEPKSLRRLADDVLADRKSREVAEWRFGDDAARGIAELCAGQGVPYIAPMRFSDAGLEKRAGWEATWALQRREDAGETLAESIPVPPKYDRKDYRDAMYFTLRGKLDVPKERFISYPACQKDAASGPLLGWAGWDHLQRAQALAALYNERKNVDGWERERLIAMLAGLLELIPWLLQWHNEPNPEFDGAKSGESYKAFLDAELNTLKLTEDDLRKWRPPERGRRRRAAARAANEPEAEGEQP